ncbi:MAG: AAA family ATPase [Bacteroidetes bacterium]|nr:AAA family ATPase [Bacteroidota bacterium]
MKIKSISIQGFRGFNEEKTINFHNRLTLIYAPNSYGKTSISEAFEWLLYGITSKVEKADSKDEYRGSYRNCHLTESLTPFVRAICVDGSSEIEFRGELVEGDAIKRFVDGREVEEWPFAHELSAAPRPFILQHALKYLLLVKPDERFQGFARLLGLEDLDRIQRNFVSLCTKPDAAIPAEVKQLLRDINALETRLVSQVSLSSIAKSFKKGKKNLAETYEAIMVECRQRVSPGTEEESIFSQLLKIREDAVGKIFKGRIALSDYSVNETQIDSNDEEFFLSCVTTACFKKYMDLITLATVQHVINRAQFLDLGVKFLDETPRKCPFCGQPVNDVLLQHIRDEHKNLARERELNAALEKQRSDVLKSLKELRNRLSAYQNHHIGKVAPLLALEPSLGQLKTILVPKHQVLFNAVEAVFSQLSPAKLKLDASFTEINAALNKVETSINEFKEDTTLMKVLGDVLVGHIAIAHSFVQVISNNVSTMFDADQILKHELDTLAGTEDISVLVDLLEQRQDIEKNFEIDGILDGLKDLRKAVDQYVANKVFNAISVELTSEVMGWYSQVKTVGDPDVHFDGFGMERTTKGELKARRVQIKATSYGKDLASAVSSLSESKLNALGLCVSIATNLKGNSPFEFLIIDDPIQSWDAEHEIQFIEVIRKLVEGGKQVILLSHNRRWMEQVRPGCRTLNGWFYEITGYTKAGPCFSEVPWEKWKERLKEVDAIVKDPNAGSVKLQQAEEEIRIVVAELTSELYIKKTGIQKSPHALNSTKVRKMLLECGVNAGLVDKIIQTYETTDDAHHAPADYSAQRERIRRYYAWVNELGQLLS